MIQLFQFESWGLYPNIKKYFYFILIIYYDRWFSSVKNSIIYWNETSFDLDIFYEYVTCITDSKGNFVFFKKY